MPSRSTRAATQTQTATVDAPPSEPSLDSDDPLASAAGRQVVDYAQWEFDSTHFGMYATTGNAGQSYDFWPCIEPQGWALGGYASEPYFPNGPTTSGQYSAYGDLYTDAGMDANDIKNRLTRKRLRVLFCIRGVLTVEIYIDLPELERTLGKD